jgi:hypothetical protein
MLFHQNREVFFKKHGSNSASFLDVLIITNAQKGCPSQGSLLDCLEKTGIFCIMAGLYS